MKYGVRLRWLWDGTDRLTLEDVIGISRTADKRSEYARLVAPDYYQMWTSEENLSAAILHRLDVANWQRGAKRGTSPPKPYVDPVQERLQKETTSKTDPDATSVITAEAIPLEEAIKAFGMENNFR